MPYDGHGLLAILRSTGPINDPISLVKCLQDNGIEHVEITLNTPGALAAISRVRQAGLPVGAGTVRTPDDAKRARDAGAGFLVTPGLVAGLGQLGLPVLMGAFTASEAMRAGDEGAVAVKLFPAASLTPDYARALLAPLDGLRLVPTGGVRRGDFAAWRAAGCSGIGIGGELQACTLPGLAERTRACVAAWSA